jgi:GAF domain-containing protein
MESTERVDVLGESTERLHVISGAMLDTHLDDELQAIAVEAGKKLGMPISLVALLLRRMQFYRAYVGLPPDVEILRATDRCVGLCQHVLKAGHVVALEDASKADVSQLLVERYNIRAYIGAPVRVGHELVGTLCCIDLKPRTFSDADCAVMEQLAARVSRRMTELAALPAEPSQVRADAEILANQVALARVSALELSPAMRIVEQALADDPSKYAAWVDLPRAHADLQRSLAEIEATVRRLQKSARVTQPPSDTSRDEKNRLPPR